MKLSKDGGSGASGRLSSRNPHSFDMLRSLRTLARAMLAITDDDPIGSEPRGEDDHRKLGRLARLLHRERGRRNQFFPGDLFAEPAWDILLDLYAATRAGEARSIKGVCLAAHAPEATALRYIDLLLGHGLVERSPDPVDRRRKYLSLTARGDRMMRDYLATMPPLGELEEGLLRYLVLSN